MGLHQEIIHSCAQMCVLYLLSCSNDVLHFLVCHLQGMSGVLHNMSVIVSLEICVTSLLHMFECLH